MQSKKLSGVVLGLDVGDVRIGIARSHSIARLPEPLEVIDRKKIDSIQRIRQVAEEQGAEAVIIGLPTLKSGQEGPQAEAVREFAKVLQAELSLPQVFVDESFTSLEADTHISTGRWKNQATNDALAACLILERYFTEGAHV